MCNVKLSRPLLALGMLVATGLALLGTAPSALAQAYTDPVWDLQQILKFRAGESSDPATLKVREQTLKKIIGQLHTISELRRAFGTV